MCTSCCMSPSCPVHNLVCLHGRWRTTGPPSSGRRSTTSATSACDPGERPFRSPVQALPFACAVRWCSICQSLPRMRYTAPGLQRLPCVRDWHPNRTKLHASTPLMTPDVMFLHLRCCRYTRYCGSKCFPALPTSAPATCNARQNSCSAGKVRQAWRHLPSVAFPGTVFTRASYTVTSSRVADSLSGPC